MTENNLEELRSRFSYSDKNIFLYRRARGYTDVHPCKWKICITATDEVYLNNLLFIISERDDCFYVKYTPKESPRARDGMMLGRVFMTSKEKTLELWKDLYGDRKLMCSLQDDDAVSSHRDL